MNLGSPIVLNLQKSRLTYQEKEDIFNALLKYDIRETFHHKGVVSLSDTVKKHGNLIRLLVDEGSEWYPHIVRSLTKTYFTQKTMNEHLSSFLNVILSYNVIIFPEKANPYYFAKLMSYTADHAERLHKDIYGVFKVGRCWEVVHFLKDKEL